MIEGGLKRSVLVAGALVVGAAEGQVALRVLGTYETGVFGEGGAEIVAYDAATRRVFSTNGAANAIDVLRLDDPSEPTLEFSIDLSSLGGGVNSVAVKDGRVAAAVEAADAQANGCVAFFDLDGELIDVIEVGALPDMVTFTPDGRFVLVANEGEPNDAYTVDPAGSVSIIPVWSIGTRFARDAMRTVGFGRYDLGGLPAGVRVSGPGATAGRDLEPEYIAVSDDSRTAYVVCQENNAVATIDIRRGRVSGLFALGAVDFGREDGGIDVSDRDGGIRISRWPVFGLRQPDAIAAYEAGGATYLVTANEGDPRGYAGFEEAARAGDVRLDPGVFPEADRLRRADQLGRLEVASREGDTDGDGDLDRLYAFGGRGISIFAADGALVYDSGGLMERVVARALPESFNGTHTKNDGFDSRSDARGPEPEALDLGEIGGRVYAFVGLERIGGVMTFDITEPAATFFVDYTNNRAFSGDAAAGTAGDLGPEGIEFIPADASPNGAPLLVVANEVSGTVTVFGVEEVSTPGD